MRPVMAALAPDTRRTVPMIIDTLATSALVMTHRPPDRRRDPPPGSKRRQTPRGCLTPLATTASSRKNCPAACFARHAARRKRLQDSITSPWAWASTIRRSRRGQRNGVRPGRSVPAGRLRRSRRQRSALRVRRLGRCPTVPACRCPPAGRAGRRCDRDGGADRGRAAPGGIRRSRPARAAARAGTGESCQRPQGCSRLRRSPRLRPQAAERSWRRGTGAPSTRISSDAARRRSAAMSAQMLLIRRQCR